MLAATGLRMGEAAGLHLEDLDLDNGVIYVRRSVWNGQELEPRTENAVREIDRSTEAVDITPARGPPIATHIPMRKSSIDNARRRAWGWISLLDPTCLVGPNQNRKEKNPQRQLCEGDQVARPAGLGTARDERSESRRFPTDGRAWSFRRSRNGAPCRTRTCDLLVRSRQCFR